VSADNPDIFTPLTVGTLNCKNRVVMAPLTRSRAGPGNVPNALNALYYAQRVSAGLIISEATQISPEGQGYISTPGIHSPEQIEGWRIVTKAVRVAGGRMVLQLWHVGRISHPSFQPGGALPVAPSAIKPNARAFTQKGFEPIPTPRALGTEEIPGIVPPLFDLPEGCAFAPRCPKADDLCRRERPVYKQTRPGHWAACWHSDG